MKAGAAGVMVPLPGKIFSCGPSAAACAFTPAETVTAVQTLENRLATGRWHVPSPAAMNAQAAALGPLNVFTGGAPTAPAFTSYSPARYLRPFSLFP